MSFRGARWPLTAGGELCTTEADGWTKLSFRAEAASASTGTAGVAACGAGTEDARPGVGTVGACLGTLFRAVSILVDDATGIICGTFSVTGALTGATVCAITTAGAAVIAGAVGIAGVEEGTAGGADTAAAAEAIAGCSSPTGGKLTGTVLAATGTVGSSKLTLTASALPTSFSAFASCVADNEELAAAGGLVTSISSEVADTMVTDGAASVGSAAVSPSTA